MGCLLQFGHMHILLLVLSALQRPGMQRFLHCCSRNHTMARTSQRLLPCWHVALHSKNFHVPNITKRLPSNSLKEQDSDMQ